MRHSLRMVTWIGVVAVAAGVAATCGPSNDSVVSGPAADPPASDTVDTGPTAGLPGGVAGSSGATPGVTGGLAVPPGGPPPAGQPPEQPGEPGVVGRVTGPDGAAVSGATVTPSSRDDPGPPIPMMAAITDGDGRYWWSLPPGSWDISVSATGFHPSSKPAVVTAGSSVTVDFQLESV